MKKLEPPSPSFIRVMIWQVQSPTKHFPHSTVLDLMSSLSLIETSSSVLSVGLTMPGTI